LFSAEDYASRAQYTTPEIRRTNLASAILQTKALRLGELDEFPFLDPPTRDAIRDGYDTLFEIQAINAERDLTDIGQTLSRLPTDPRIGRILLAAEELNCLHEVAIIAAGLEVPDPRQRPLEHAAKADELHAQWTDPRSDFLSLLNLFDFYQRLKADLSRSKLARACQQNFLSPHHLREWVDVHRQLQAMIQEFRWRIQPRRDDYDAVANLAGFWPGGQSSAVDRSGGVGRNAAAVRSNACEDSAAMDRAAGRASDGLRL
jgi:ATP-dependent helicase HrpA